ncbi:MAG: ADP-ribosyl-[dinitrogen reductase] hydrolase [SAR324 cluster bacterium]|nr:ADP-ribosyl-[dinitrogen reductase] hydrolase [SAR324 cluster bacterium]
MEADLLENPTFTLGPEVKERMLASYLGCALGDALGATTEFLTLSEIAKKHGVHKEITGGGWLHLRAGRVTDDTEMNLALGRALIQARGYDGHVVANEFVLWMRAKPVDMGSTVRQGIRAYIETEKLEQEEAEWMGGNGALMRNLPSILATIGDEEKMKEWSLAQARITHHHPDADDGLIMMAQMIHLALLKGGRAQLKTLAFAWAEKSKRWDYRRYKLSIDGYICNTVKVVLHFFFTTGDFEDCMIGIVNAGGDTDTNAAIAGMLAGAFYGLESLPKRWLKAVERKTTQEIETQVNQIWEIFHEPKII